MLVEVNKPVSWDNTADYDPDALWADIRKGQKEALSKLFCLFYSPLYKYGIKIVPKRAFIKDSIQELFLNLWSQRNQIKQAYSVSSYLFHSLRRIILRNLKKRKNQANRNQIYIDNFLEENYNIEELIVSLEIKQEKKEQLSQALESLSIRQKEAILLKFYDGMSSTEIAHVMGINQQSVYNYVSEAISKLQGVVQQ